MDFQPKTSTMEEIFKKYHRKVYNFVYGQLLHRENAEDVTAAVFLALYHNISRLDTSQGDLTAWIFTVARNMVRNFVKNPHSQREILGEVPETPAQEAQDDVDSLKNPDNIYLAKTLALLSEEERELLTLRYILDLTNEEVGKMIGKSSNTVSQKYRRLLLKCRSIYENIRDE